MACEMSQLNWTVDLARSLPLLANASGEGSARDHTFMDLAITPDISSNDFDSRLVKDGERLDDLVVAVCVTGLGEAQPSPR